MISRLNLINYESHKNTSLAFPEGLTVFIGESDKGKSGAFRGFEWLRTNRPLGNSMRPLFRDTELSEVSVELYSGEVISRYKGKGVNEYSISDWSSNAGTEVPVEVSSLLNMEDIHFQSQIDRPFLMFDSAGERGRVLNRIAGLDKIDSSIRNASQDVRRINTKRQSNKSEILTIKEELVQFENLPDINNLIIQMEMLETGINQKQSIVSRICKLLPRKEECEEILKKESILNQLSKKVVESSILNDKVKSKVDILDRVVALKLEVKELQETRDRKHILVNIQRTIKKLEKHWEKLSKLEGKYDQVNSLIFQYDKKDGRLIDVEALLKEIKSNLPNICPECGEPLK